MTEFRFFFLFVFFQGLRAEEAAVFLSAREMLCLFETYANLKSTRPAPRPGQFSVEKEKLCGGPSTTWKSVSVPDCKACLLMTLSVTNDGGRFPLG